MTLYERLSISQVANQVEIESAYHRSKIELEKKLDPTDDGNSFIGGGTNSTVKAELTALEVAYQILKDPEKRRQYNEKLRNDQLSKQPMPQSLDSSSFLADLFVMVKKPLVIIVIIVAPLIFIQGMFKSSQTNSAAERVAVAERIIESNNSISSRHEERKSHIDNRYEDRKIQEMEYAHKVSEENHKLKLAKQERRLQELEYANQNMQDKIRLEAQEQDRKDRRLEYQSNAGNRILNLEERRQKLNESETNYERQHTNEMRTEDRSRSRIYSMNREIEIRKDMQARKLGVSRKKYDEILRNRNQ